MQWTWQGADFVYGPHPSVTIDGTRLIWNLPADHDAKAGGKHAEQTFEDFRTYGPAWNSVPPDIIEQLTTQPGLENPPWRQPGYDPYSEAWHLIEKGDEARALTLAADEDPHREYRYGTTLLMHAAANRMAAVVRQLIDRGSSVNHRNDVGETALTCAVSARNGSLPAVQLLVAAGAGPIDEAVVLAIRGYNQDITEWLLRQGAELADLNYMMTIARHGWLEALRLLLSRGADPNFLNRDKSTPLMWAGAREIVELLLGAGADPNIKTPVGETALSLACASGSAWKVDALLEGGADPNSRSYQFLFNKTHGQPVLRCLIAAERSPEIVQLLLSAGADPDLI